MATTSPITVAIVGGGMAGATLANALLRLPHIAVQVFESKPEFSERAAGIGLAFNAQLAVKECMDDFEHVFRKAGGVPIAGTRFMMGAGPASGSLIVDLESEKGTEEGIIHRGSLLRELHAPLPKGLLHWGKKLDSIEENETGNTRLVFADGSTHTADVVIGADGVFSAVRDFVVGKDQQGEKKFASTPAGFWDCRKLVPRAEAEAAFGEGMYSPDRQWVWFGDGAFIMYDTMEDGAVVQCVLSAVERGPVKDRKHIVTKEFLEKTFENWKKDSIAAAMMKLMVEGDGITAWPEWEHKTTPTYARGRVCIMGDAAHATTPWMGAGAGQAFEDAMVLAALLKSVKSTEDVANAFQAYDAIRRPRGQRVIDSSRETGLLVCGRTEVELVPETLMPALAPRWGFLNIDTKAHIGEALAEYQRLCGEAQV